MENDRRRYPRISCNGNATIDLGAALPSKASIVDLSAEGCLLKFDKPQNIRANAEMLMTFEVENIPFGVIAKAKSIRSATSVGVHFPEMTQAGRSELQGLIGLMSQFAPQPAATLMRSA